MVRVFQDGYLLISTCGMGTTKNTDATGTETIFRVHGRYESVLSDNTMTVPSADGSIRFPRDDTTIT